VKQLGVLGTMIWDHITGRDPRDAPVEEWGGISYALAALDASLPAGWRVVPLVKVGRDLAPRALTFLRDLARVAPDARFVETPGTNPRVRLSYRDGDRRCEGLTGDVPRWTWDELGPMVLGLDALYVNFITGFECDLPTAQALRHAFAGPVYGDLHSLALGRRPDGERYYRPIEEALAWLSCFDVVQVNEDEMAQLGSDPFALASRALERGVSAVCVTLGARGALYVAAGDPHPFAWATRGAPRPAAHPGGGAWGGSGGAVVRTARVAPEGDPVSGDPTGCGDVFGATLAARLLQGDALEDAMREANRMARRNVTFRGATGLARHLAGRLA
jgi:sugar/nucleoside kinase (ribokinase family)